MPDGVNELLDFFEVAFPLDLRDQRFSRFIAIHAGKFPGNGKQMSGFVEDFDERETILLG